MKRNIALLLLASTSILFACGEAPSASSGTSSEAPSETSSAASSETSQQVSSEVSSSEEANEYLDTLLREQTIYSISYDYRITNDEDTITYASGFSDKRLFIGKDNYGSDLKILNMQGQDTTYVPSLDENPSSSSTYYSVYYTTTRTYTRQANGQYTYVNENHDEATFSLLTSGFDFRQAASFTGTPSGRQTIITAVFDNDAQATAYLGTALGSEEAAVGINDLTVSTTVNSYGAFVSSRAEYAKNGYYYHISWRYSSVMPNLTLPNV